MPPKKSKPNFWDKALVFANIALVIVTIIYVTITGCTLHQIKEQTDIIRSGNIETLKPYLIPVIDTLRIKPSNNNGKMVLIPTIQLNIKNDGQTHAQIVFLGIGFLPLNKNKYNVRDSLLKSTNNNIQEDTSNILSKFIPPHNSISYVFSCDDIQNKISSGNKTFLHIVIIYRDTFKKYHDIYCVYKIYVDKPKYCPPIYDFYDYKENEIENILNKIDND